MSDREESRQKRYQDIQQAKTTAAGAKPKPVRRAAKPRKKPKPPHQP